MDIYYKDERLKKLCTSIKLLTKKFGDVSARAIIARQEQLKNSEDLFDFSSFMPSAKCHELTHRSGKNRRGELAVTAGKANRMIFIPADDPPYDDNGKLIWKEIRAVKIISVEDYHHG